MNLTSVGFRCMILMLVLLVPVPAPATGFTCTKLSDSGDPDRDDGPEEVSIRVQDTTYSPRGMQAWLTRLVGKYSYDGYVDLCGSGNPQDQRPVSGKADCVAARSTPNVHCRINVQWPETTGKNGTAVPGGVSNLSPAQLLFSIEIPTRYVPLIRGAGVNGWGLVLLQVDNANQVEWASGVLVGDTFIASERCPGMSNRCRKTTQITVTPDDSKISMVVDVSIDGQRTLRQVFLMHRGPDSRRGAQPAGSPR